MDKVLIIYTGGTIGMKVNNVSNSLVPLNFNTLLDEIPEIKKINVHLEFISFKTPLDSSDISVSHWYKLAGIIYKNYTNYNGFVVLHGTDTLSYTSSALSFLLNNLSKPIVFTGSQLPIGDLRTDAKENIITSLEISTLKNEEGKPLLNEVLIYFEYCLLRANRSTKTSVKSFKAFSSPNYPLIGESGTELKIHKQHTLIANSEQNIELNPTPSKDLATLKFYPGLLVENVQAILNLPIRALIIETFGAGNTTSEKWFINLLHKAIVKKNLIILNISQCAEGLVEQGKYSTSLGLKSIGVISGKDITYEAALTKTMCLLGKYSDNTVVKKKLQKNLKGEITL